jgi:hypothetical protein
MDGVSGVTGGSAMDIAASGSSAVAVSVLAGTEKLMADLAARLFASLGVGANVDARA